MHNTPNAANEPADLPTDPCRPAYLRPWRLAHAYTDDLFSEEAFEQDIRDAMEEAGFRLDPPCVKASSLECGTNNPYGVSSVAWPERPGERFTLEDREEEEARQAERERRKKENDDYWAKERATIKAFVDANRWRERGGGYFELVPYRSCDDDLYRRSFGRAAFTVWCSKCGTESRGVGYWSDEKKRLVKREGWTFLRRKPLCGQCATEKKKRASRWMSP